MSTLHASTAERPRRGQSRIYHDLDHVLFTCVHISIPATVLKNLALGHGLFSSFKLAGQLNNKERCNPFHRDRSADRRSYVFAHQYRTFFVPSPVTMRQASANKAQPSESLWCDDFTERMRKIACEKEEFSRNLMTSQHIVSTQTPILSQGHP
ncbi:hypothetical protein K437DRAFT_42627 [Tilletiaria anomala UBC 951]|uniref:Uncharacterized protein n=1 Tax=Tilletiaria anomala (strain ATCC 24038 / CBS 436.72 / UBC 951) TaxID=1037660 RepID=A0A066VF49_TILAU|nr:uncharacterized protein K437DRAFT_42627 [Tilletiaria anomala UBC 951]KDN37225.1 hypothetical protein K437DRAFT_42627 [Tilletiaria anomala UBC 951]